jgi:hypothetical protein
MTSHRNGIQSTRISPKYIPGRAVKIMYLMVEEEKFGLADRPGKVSTGWLWRALRSSHGSRSAMAHDKTPAAIQSKKCMKDA